MAAVLSTWRDRLRHALGFRLALWYAVIFLASATTLVALTYVLLAASLRQYDRETLRTSLLQLASAYTRGGLDALEREIRRNQATTAPGPLMVRIVGRRQQLIYLEVPEPLRGFDPSRLAAPEETPEGLLMAIETDDGRDLLEVASLRLADGTLFQVGKSTQRRTELLRRFRSVLLLDLGSVLLIALAGGALLTWYALRPVRTLAGTVRQILRTGKTDARVPVADSRDALGELTLLVNAMLDRIDAVIGGMRGALDNVAHDLRTPMARLRGIAETALASDDPATLRTALADCLEESDRVVGMLHTLMDISEAETGTMALRRETVDLHEIVERTVDLYEDVAEERGIALDMRQVADLQVFVDRNRIRQVLANVVDNAVKYTQPGGRVEIAAWPEGAAVVIAIADTGPGIPPEDLPHIWDRLYRGDRSRSTRGLGLGLTLVKAIVEAHGGRVAVESTAEAGTRFELRLPAARADLSPM